MKNLWRMGLDFGKELTVVLLGGDGRIVDPNKPVEAHVKTGSALSGDRGELYGIAVPKHLRFAFSPSSSDVQRVSFLRHWCSLLQHLPEGSRVDYWGVYYDPASKSKRGKMKIQTPDSPRVRTYTWDSFRVESAEPTNQRYAK